MAYEGRERRQAITLPSWARALAFSLLIPLLTLVYLYGRLNERVDNLVQRVGELQRTVDMLVVKHGSP